MFSFKSAITAFALVTCCFASNERQFVRVTFSDGPLNGESRFGLLKENYPENCCLIKVYPIAADIEQEWYSEGCMDDMFIDRNDEEDNEVRDIPSSDITKGYGGRMHTHAVKREWCLAEKGKRIELDEKKNIVVKCSKCEATLTKSRRRLSSHRLTERTGPRRRLEGSESTEFFGTAKAASKLVEKELDTLELTCYQCNQSAFVAAEGYKESNMVACDKAYCNNCGGYPGAITRSWVPQRFTSAELMKSFTASLSETIAPEDTPEENLGCKILILKRKAIQKKIEETQYKITGLSYLEVNKSKIYSNAMRFAARKAAHEEFLTALKNYEL